MKPFDIINKIRDTKCPRRRAFIQHLNMLFHTRDDVMWRHDETQEDFYQEQYAGFVNLWCPVLLEYEEKQDEVV